MPDFLNEIIDESTARSPKFPELLATAMTNRPTVRLAALTLDYQTLLEKHRQDPDCEQTWQLYVQTRSELTREWLEHAVKDG